MYSSYLLDQPVRQDEAAREAPREPGVPPHVRRHSREAELAVLQRDLAIAVEVGNRRVLVYLRSDQLRDATEDRLHSAARGQPRAGGACPPCSVRACAAREGRYTRIPGTGRARNARARGLMGYADTSYVNTSYADDTSYDVQVGARAACSCAVVTQPTCSAPAAHAWRDRPQGGRAAGAERRRGEDGAGQSARAAGCGDCAVRRGRGAVRKERGVRAERCRPVAGRVRYGRTAGAHQQRPDC